MDYDNQAVTRVLLCKQIVGNFSEIHKNNTVRSVGKGRNFDC